jgi:hypothetical protein
MADRCDVCKQIPWHKMDIDICGTCRAQVCNRCMIRKRCKVCDDKCNVCDICEKNNMVKLYKCSICSSKHCASCAFICVSCYKGACNRCRNIEEDLCTMCL